jgi:hypothetical protein
MTIVLDVFIILLVAVVLRLWDGSSARVNASAPAVDVIVLLLLFVVVQLFVEQWFCCCCLECCCCGCESRDGGGLLATVVSLLVDAVLVDAMAVGESFLYCSKDVAVNVCCWDSFESRCGDANG